MPRDGTLHPEMDRPQETGGTAGRGLSIGAGCAAVLLHAAAIVGIWAWPSASPHEPEAVVVSLEFLPAPTPSVAPTPEPPEAKAEPPQPAPTPAPEPEPPEEVVETLPEKPTPRIPPPPQKPAPPRVVTNTAPPAAPSTAPAVTAPPIAAAPRPATTAQPPYTAVLLAWLERHRTYPRAARMRGIEGQVTVRIALDREGKLLASGLTRTSGHGMLDDAALETVRRAAPFPPLLDAQGGPRFEFLVPVDFALQR